MYDEDIPLIINFHNSVGHSKNTIKSYKTAFNKYRNFHKMSLKQLLKEAKTEQEEKIAEHDLSVYDRINNFKLYLVNNHTGNTPTSTLNKIKTFYQYNRIRLPFIPPINKKFVKQNDFISYDDLLTKEELLKGLRIANDYVRNWIMVMISSGSSRNECSLMTNQILYNGTFEFHQKDNFPDALKYLSKHDNIVCTCKLIRMKTNKPYYTFLNPETVQIIAKNKLREEDFKLNNKLLKYSPDYLGKQCKIINDFLKLGTAGGYSRFRPHMFRKYHATHLYQNINHLTISEIDQFQGRGKNTTQESYYKNNPEILKLNYVKVMNNISLYNTYEYEIKDDKIIIKTKYVQ